MKRSRRAFTLVELLVVIAIIGILIGMLLPAVQQVREASRRTHCLSNLRQVGLATTSFHDSQGAFPPSRLSTPAGIFPQATGPESWFVRILPFVEQSNLYRLWDLTQPYDSQEPEARLTPVDTFLCSSRHSGSDAVAPDVTVGSQAGGCG